MATDIEQALRAENIELRARLQTAQQAGDLAKGSKRFYGGFVSGVRVFIRALGARIAAHGELKDERNGLAHKQAEERLAAIIHCSDDAIIGKTLEGIITSWNPGAVRMFGYGAEEIIGKPALTLIPPERVAEEAGILQRIAQGLSVETFETVRLKKDGNRLHAAVTISAIRDREGRIVGASKIARNITSYKEAEARMRHSEEVHRVAFEMAPMGMTYVSTEGRFVHVNQKYCQITGYSEVELLGIKVSELTYPEDVPGDAALLKDFFSGRSEIYQNQKRYVRKDGSVCWVDVTGRNVMDAQGKPLHSIGIIQDITTRKHGEEKILRFNAELERRVSERTTALQAAVDALEAEIRARRRLEQELLETSEREQRRLGQDLHDDLGQQLAGIGILVHLIQMHLTAEAHPKADEAAQLGVFCTQALTTARDLAKSFYPVELELHGLVIALENLALRSSRLAQVRCEARFDTGFRASPESAIHLYRIVQESISNALRHGKARHIQILGTSHDGIATLSVTNDGLGFNAPEKGQDTGIGLHIFQYRARLIGAELKVERVRESGGGRVSCVWATATEEMTAQE